MAARLVITTNAIRLLRTAVYEATDRAAPPELCNEIVQIAESEARVIAIEKCLVRKSGAALFVELHVEINPKATVEEGHHIAHTVKAALLEANPRIQDVLVHIEPHSPPRSQHNPSHSARSLAPSTAGENRGSCAIGRKKNPFWSVFIVRGATSKLRARPWFEHRAGIGARPRR